MRRDWYEKLCQGTTLHPLMYHLEYRRRHNGRRSYYIISGYLPLIESILCTIAAKRANILHFLREKLLFIPGPPHWRRTNSSCPFWILMSLLGTVDVFAVWLLEEKLPPLDEQPDGKSIHGHGDSCSFWGSLVVERKPWQSSTTRRQLAITIWINILSELFRVLNA